MKLVCATEYWLGKYQDLVSKRNLAFRPWLSRSSLLAVEGEELAAGAMAYDSTGPFLFFEHLVTNPDLPARTRWAAVNLMAVEMLSMCRHLGKVPQVTVRHKGILKILERAGLKTQGAIVMTCGFDQLETNDNQEFPFPPSKHPRRFPDSALTERSPAGDSEDDLGVYASVLGGAGGATCCGGVE